LVKKREGHRVIFSDLAQNRIKEECCPNCGKSKTEWKRTTKFRCCSKDCTEKFWEEQVVVSSWGDLREKCFIRDNYTCKICGIKPVPTETKWIRAEEGRTNEGDMWASERTPIENPKHRHYSAFLTADHIKAIALGGEEWDINNLQTLCKDCDRVKTAKDFKLIAQLRAIEKKRPNGQTLLTEGR
jgi:5-methylcytosine-specific restriction endonuclease McrA